MQPFQEVQKSLHSIGFSTKLEPFNRRTLCILALCIPSLILTCIYPIHVADSAQQLIESIYVILVGTGTTLSFMSMMLVREKIFTLIECVEEHCNEIGSSFDQSNREQPESCNVNLKLKSPTSKEIFDNTNDFVEKWSRIGLIFMNRLVVLFVVCPRIIVSLFNYLATDLGNDAFDLAFPMW